MIENNVIKDKKIKDIEQNSNKNKIDNLDTSKENTNEIINNKKQTFIEYPLTESIKKMINNDLEKHGIKNKLEIINHIEEELELTSIPVKLYKSLCNRLELYLKDDTKRFVGKLLLFKRKMCRNGNECNRKATCIFIHPDENGTENYDFKRRKIENNDEIILNKIPDNLARIDEVEKYCLKFGSINYMKRLKPGKFLIKFNDYKSAAMLINSNEHVMDNENITKFYNCYSKLFLDDEYKPTCNENNKYFIDDHNRLDMNYLDVNKIMDFLEEEDILINQLYKKGESNIATKLRILTTKIREEIMKSDQ